MIYVVGTFNEADENKVEYTELFQAYTVLVEKALDDELKAKIEVSPFITLYHDKSVGNIS